MAAVATVPLRAASWGGRRRGPTPTPTVPGDRAPLVPGPAPPWGLTGSGSSENTCCPRRASLTSERAVGEAAGRGRVGPGVTVEQGGGG